MSDAAEKAWEALTLADHQILSSAYAAGGTEAGARFLARKAFVLGYHARDAEVAEKSARIIEIVDLLVMATPGNNELYHITQHIKRLAEEMVRQQGESGGEQNAPSQQAPEIS